MSRPRSPSDPRIAGAVICWGSIALALLWALGAWLVASGTSGVWAVAQVVVTVAGIAALGRLALRARSVWRGQAGTDAFALPMLAAFGLAALWWLTVALASF